MAKITRRDFVKMATAALASLFLNSCVPPKLVEYLASATNQSSTATQAATSTYSPTPASTPTSTSTPTQTATPAPSELDRLVSLQGPAFKIPSIEYHGLYFKMSDSIQMTPEWFEDQMRWLSDNGFHSVTGPELNGYLAGSIQLPAKSVILTFDLGAVSAKEFDEAIAPTMKNYGQHGFVYLVTCEFTNAIDKGWAADCWKRYARWADSGIATYGSHGVNHLFMDQIPYEKALLELSESKSALEENLGREVDSMAWPYEAFSVKGASLLSETGYKSGFGGWSRSITDLQVWPNDPLWWNLPRLMPYSQPGSYPFLTSRTPGITFPELITRNITPPKN
jgi:peptidoglycan/xylan/chitin deacetylase (PgdA/CDA1 family)